MDNIKNFFKSPHIQIALATGFSIVIMAYFSKRVLKEPIGFLTLAIPPFLATLYETLLDKYKERKFCTTWYWVVAIIASTFLVIFFSWI